MKRWLRTLWIVLSARRYPAAGGAVQMLDRESRRRRTFMLSPGGLIADPDEAEALGLTVEARRMRKGEFAIPADLARKHEALLREINE